VYIKLQVRENWPNPAAVLVLGFYMQPFACWNYGFESPWMHRCFTWVICVLCW